MSTQTKPQSAGKYTPTLLYVFGIYGSLSALTISVLNIYLRDGNIGLQILGWSQVVIYLFSNIIFIWALVHRNMLQLQRSFILLFSAAILFISFMFIVQLAGSYINENGTAKLPITQPHNALWYQVKSFFVIYTYVAGVISIIQAIVSSLFIKNLSREKQSHSLTDNVQQIYSEGTSEVVLLDDDEKDFQWVPSMESMRLKKKSIDGLQPAFLQNTFPSKPNLMIVKSQFDQSDPIVFESNLTHESQKVLNSPFNSSGYYKL